MIVVICRLQDNLIDRAEKQLKCWNQKGRDWNVLKEKIDQSIILLIVDFLDKSWCQKATPNVKYCAKFYYPHHKNRQPTYYV